MLRTKAVFCALALATIAGCPPRGQLLMPNDQSDTPADHYAAGSVQVVSGRARSLLQSFGITAVATPEGDNVRLRCTTAGGGHFSLVLMQANTADGERTQVRLDWQDGHDEQLGIRIMAGLGILEGI